MDQPAQPDKTKRLLSLARAKLEENQAALAQRDLQIQQLIAAVDEERSSNSSRFNKKGGTKVDDESNASTPRTILRRVDVADGAIWVLVDCEGNVDDYWIRFSAEDELRDYVQRLPGAPLTIPNKCLTTHESAKIENESARKVERVVEEFRRFKVKAEIALKQKDAELKHSSASTLSPVSSKDRLEGGKNGGGGGGDADVSTYISELKRVKAALSEQEGKWKAAYEKVVRENELLKARGGEALLAVQWRERYENCVRERNDLSEKLSIYTKVELSELSMGSGEAMSPGPSTKSIAEAYLDLRDEYRDFRRRVSALERQRSESSALASPGSLDMTFAPAEARSYVEAFNSKASGSKMSESKMQYIKQMVLQYLSCRDGVVRPHIEAALVAMLRFSEEERAAIELRRRDEAQDAISSIGSYLGVDITYLGLGGSGSA